MTTPLFGAESLSHAVEITRRRFLRELDHGRLRPGREVDLYWGVCQAIIGDIAGELLFGIDTSDQQAALRAAITAGLSSIRPTALDIILPIWFPLPDDIRRRRTTRRIDKVVDELIALADTSAGRRQSVVARLREAAPDMPHQKLRSMLKTILAAGFRTTAAGLFFALAVLEKDTRSAYRVLEEARNVDVRRADGESLLAALPFTRMVALEALRFYPPAPNVAREALEDDMVFGIRIRRGDQIAISPWLIHHHHDLWHDPEAFDPERFRGKNGLNDVVGYIPFGLGPRFCTGAQMALQQIVLGIALVLRERELTLVGDKPVVPKGGVVLHPAQHYRFAITERRLMPSAGRAA